METASAQPLPTEPQARIAPTGKRATAVAAPRKRVAWPRTVWIFWMLALPLLVTAISVYASQASAWVVLGQAVLLLGVRLAFALLSNQPLFTPVQAVVFFFFWWFGVAPAVVGGWYVLIGNPAAAQNYLESGMHTAWVVAPGLPLYALVARRTLGWLKRHRIHARFLLPEGPRYKLRTLLVYWGVGAGITLLLRFLPSLGIQGITATNYLGARLTTVWWVGVLEAVSGLSVFATVSLIGYLALPGRTTPLWLKLLALLIVAQMVLTGLTSGWKSAMVAAFLYWFCAYFSLRQRPPIWLMLGMVLLFLLIVEPFVTRARIIAEREGIRSPEERVALFSRLLDEGALLTQRDWTTTNPSALFRGIYRYSGTVMERSTLLSGPWQGRTVIDGFLSLVPRAMLPAKPQMNTGNFIARSLGYAAPTNFVHSIGVTIPFEFIGNWGWLAGVLAFGLVGLLWALISGWWLSVPRLADHPLAPYLVTMAMTLEGALVPFLAKFRDQFIMLLAAYVLWRLLNRKL